MEAGRLVRWLRERFGVREKEEEEEKEGKGKVKGKMVVVAELAGATKKQEGSYSQTLQTGCSVERHAGCCVCR